MRNYTKIFNSLSDAQKDALDHLMVVGGDIESKDMNPYSGKVSAWRHQEWDDIAGYRICNVLSEISASTWVALANKGLIVGTREEGGRRRWDYTVERDKMRELHLTPLGLRLGDMQHQKSSVNNWCWRLRKLINRLYLIDQVTKGEWVFTDPESELADLFTLREGVVVKLSHPYLGRDQGDDYSQFTLSLEFKYGIRISLSSEPFVSSYDGPDSPSQRKNTQYKAYVRENGRYTVEVKDSTHPLHLSYGSGVNAGTQVLAYAQELIEAQRVCDLVNQVSDHETGLIQSRW